LNPLPPHARFGENQPMPFRVKEISLKCNSQRCIRTCTKILFVSILNDHPVDMKSQENWGYLFIRF
jgi:hypothetical protein